jgi:hypothetical protein
VLMMFHIITKTLRARSFRLSGTATERNGFFRRESINRITRALSETAASDVRRDSEDEAISGI